MRAERRALTGASEARDGDNERQECESLDHSMNISARALRGMNG
jgi:hypothetical protein